MNSWVGVWRNHWDAWKIRRQQRAALRRLRFQLRLVNACKRQLVKQASDTPPKKISPWAVRQRLAALTVNSRATAKRWRNRLLLEMMCRLLLPASLAALLARYAQQLTDSSKGASTTPRAR